MEPVVLNYMRNVNQVGDTIVEVLIAIVIITSVLVAAYQTTSRNTNLTQDTQEHSQALKLAESQLEYLRQYTGSGSSFDPTQNDCFYRGAPNTDTTNNTDPSQCNVQSAPGAAMFKVRLTRPTSTGPFKADVTWQSIASHATADVTLYYRPPEVMP